MSENTNKVELTRANKVTAYWEGDGVAVAVFYKTHNKLLSVRSTDESVIAAGFEMPTGTEEAPVTASQKLEAFKNFIQANASKFGMMYDPVDRREDIFKFPSHYDNSNILEYSRKMLENAIEAVLESVQNNVIAKMVKNELIPADSAVQYGVGEAVLNVTENYSNGFIKYATVTYPIAIVVGGKRIDTNVVVDLVSGQIKKPRTIGDTVMTMTGIKDMLVEGGVLPKVEPKAKKERSSEDEGKDVAEDKAE